MNQVAATPWLAALLRLRGRGLASVLVSVVSTKGSAPRLAGARMVVSAETVDGTIGGGHLEFSAIRIAREMLGAMQVAASDLRRFPLGASLGQCCGGLVNLLFEPVSVGDGWVQTLASLRGKGVELVVATPADRVTGNAKSARLIVTGHEVFGSLGNAAHDARTIDAARAVLAERGGAELVRIARDNESAEALVFLDPLRDADFEIVLFGAGHVGRAVVRVLAEVPCHVTWVDARESEFPSELPGNVTVIATDTPEAEVVTAPRGAYFLVMTHSHPLDQSLAEAILLRGGYSYFGLIGSVSKRRQFERRMAQRGIPAKSFADMTCPIGVPGIKGKEPATIAVAVAAQLLQVKEQQAVSDRPLDVAANE